MLQQVLWFLRHRRLFKLPETRAQSPVATHSLTSVNLPVASLVPHSNSVKSRYTHASWLVTSAGGSGNENVVGSDTAVIMWPFANMASEK